MSAELLSVTSISSAMMVEINLKIRGKLRALEMYATGSAMPASIKPLSYLTTPPPPFHSSMHEHSLSNDIFVMHEVKQNEIK